jgi:hypothetical protein
MEMRAIRCIGTEWSDCLCATWNISLAERRLQWLWMPKICKSSLEAHQLIWAVDQVRRHIYR